MNSPVPSAVAQIIHLVLSSTIKSIKIYLTFSDVSGINGIFTKKRLTSVASPKIILKQFWSYDSFRPLQEEIINSVLNGEDTLALLPTGGGKSICFQVPTLCRDGICIVISPLIALMKDQVANLRAKNIKAEAIYSGISKSNIDRILDNCKFGDIKFLYVSPERLKTDLAMTRISQMNVSLIAVDEAHCISQWGYDFRPSYLEIAELRKVFPDVPVVALTATATQKVVEDIQEKLEFKKSNLMQKSFQRSNLWYVVVQEENKRRKLLEILQKIPGSGIVYTRSRKKTVEIAKGLQHYNITADYYHAGLTNDQRSKKQEDWISDKTRIIVSTNAFGMGIDKPNVRIVVHMDLPDSIEAYFQEAGRAGRDEEQSYGVLLYNDEDRTKLERNFENSYPPMEEIRRVYRALGNYYQMAIGSGMGRSLDFHLQEFINRFNFEPLPTYNALKILETNGYISISESVSILAKVKVKVSKDILYDFLLKNKKYEIVIKAILRVYQGAFEYPVNVDEHKLSKFVKLDKRILVQRFEELHKFNIIYYTPAKNKPQLTYLLPRENADDLVLDFKRLQFLKERYRTNINAVIRYAEEETCRQVQLLNYFGEEVEKCGTCDVCRSIRVDGMTIEESTRLKNKIRRMLLKDGLTYEEVVDSFHTKINAKVVSLMSYLLAEKFIVKEKDSLVWADPKK